MKSYICYIGGICLLSHVAMAQALPERQETLYPHIDEYGRVEQHLVHAKQYMVSSASPYASEAGMRILQKGGTAIDAAIAVQMVLTLVEPESSGIGGGGFALYWDNTGKQLSSYDGRETAPIQADETLFQADGANMNWWEALAGGRAVGTPGIVAMLTKVHQKYGKLPWHALFEDAIQLAEEGFEVSPKLARSITDKTNPALGRYETAWRYFFPGGKPLAAGTMKKNPELAMTFRRLALLGAKSFYKGQIALDIVDTVQTAADNPGLLTTDDLARYQAIERPPVCASYKAYQLCGMGPPTSGGMTVIQILKLLENKALYQHQPISVESAHAFTQAARLAYADRAKYMADADFVSTPVAGLINADYLRQRATLIAEKDMRSARAGTPPNANRDWLPSGSPEQPGTTHFSIVDAQGNGFSMTSSIEMAFGSTLMVRGFLLNNQLTDFSFSDQHQDGTKIANRVQGGKRPRSSMSPFMVFDQQGELVMLVGSPGGSRIINYVAKTMLGVLEWGLDIQTAINLPHYSNRNGRTELEQGTSAETLKTGLEAKGHDVIVRTLNSGIHGIVITPEGLFGGADPRRLGKVLGR